MTFSLQFPDFVDPPVGGPVDLQDVHRNPVPDLLAEGTLIAGVAVGPSWQFKALARIRATEVLPTPRGPANR